MNSEESAERSMLFIVQALSWSLRRNFHTSLRKRHPERAAESFAIVRNSSKSAAKAQWCQLLPDLLFSAEMSSESTAVEIPTLLRVKELCTKSKLRET